MHAKVCALNRLFIIFGMGHCVGTGTSESRVGKIDTQRALKVAGAKGREKLVSPQIFVIGYLSRFGIGISLRITQ